jgi:hypothetical protein
VNYTNDDPRYIERQLGLFGGLPETTGFGTSSFHVRLIECSVARALIREHHYSQSVVANSDVHLGVFIQGALQGVLQYGPAMNPASGGSIVRGTTVEGYRELNRMWLDDIAPANTASRAISYSVKLLRRIRPSVMWIQSFADERCGRLGVVYQASNFLFCGSHRAKFWELDGEWYHNICMTVRGDARVGRPDAIHLQANKERAVMHTFDQYRYILPLHRSVRAKLLLPVLPYPKHAEILPGVDELGNHSTTSNSSKAT